MRFALLALLALLLTPNADAQRRLTGRAGLVIATFGDAGGRDLSPYIAPAAGLSIRYPILRTFDAEFDLGVLPRGATSRDEAGNEERLRFSYFDLSLLGRAHVETRDRLRFAAFAGPTLSVLLQEAVENNFGQVQTDFGLSKGTHLAGTVGVVGGYRDVLLEVRYVRGLSTFVVDELRVSADGRPRDYVHQALVISAGLRL